MANHYPSLNPQKAQIWRIAHHDNLPWYLDKGVRYDHDASSHKELA